MFARRHKPTLFKQIRNMFWPDMGWRRTFRYLQYRLARHPSTPQELASSLSIGAVTMFIPIPGTHIASALACCWLLRLPLMPAILGTLVGNPWTIPFAWLAAYSLGVWATEVMAIPHIAEIPAGLNVEEVFQLAMKNPMMILLPWTLAGVALAIAFFPVFYVIFLLVMREARVTIELFRKSRKLLAQKLDIS